jgi:hypothetical protein
MGQEQYRMRKYNFPVGFVDAAKSSVLCRIRFNPRFEAADMVDDFPKNVTAGFLDQVVRAPGAPPHGYRVADGNAVEIAGGDEARPLSDSQRAIVLNLMDFGQDFESEVSTTIDEVEFPVSGAASYSTDKLLAALTAENEAAVARMSALMQQFPSGSEDAARDWPSDDHERYFYQVRFEFSKPMQQTEMAGFEGMLKALHEENMWTGISPDRDVEEIIQSGRTGLSYEIDVDPGSMSYIVERPACNPALSAVWLWQRVEDSLGKPAEGSMIFVTAED